MENGILFKIENGKVYFENNKGYGAEECMAVVNGLVGLINSKTLLPTITASQPKNVINYEDILDKRIVKGDESKSTQKLKQWLDNDPEVLEEDGNEQFTIL